jgi:hypothetical protein
MAWTTGFAVRAVLWDFYWKSIWLSQGVLLILDLIFSQIFKLTRRPQLSQNIFKYFYNSNHLI